MKRKLTKVIFEEYDDKEKVIRIGEYSIENGTLLVSPDGKKIQLISFSIDFSKTEHFVGFPDKEKS